MILGRVDGFDQDQAASEREKRGLVPCGLLAASGDAIGSLDHLDAVRPEMHWGIESQVPWLALHDDLPRKPIESDPEYMAKRQQPE